MTEKHFLMHLINNLTSEYDYQVAMVEKRLDSDKNPLTLEELRADLNLRYERLGLKKKDEDEKEYDVALAGFPSKFKGKCRKCGVIGHKAANCRSGKQKQGSAYYSGQYSPPNNNVNNSTQDKTKKQYPSNTPGDGWTMVKGKGNHKFEGTCNYCGKYGHKFVESQSLYFWLYLLR